MTFERFFERELDQHVLEYQDLLGEKLDKAGRKKVRAHFRTSKVALDNARRFHRMIYGQPA